MDLAPACSNIRLNVKKQTLKRIYVPQKKKGEKNTSQSKLPRITKNRRHTIQIFAFDKTTWHNDNKQVIIYIERNFWKRILQCFSSLFRLMKTRETFDSSTPWFSTSSRPRLTSLRGSSQEWSSRICDTRASRKEGGLLER